MAILDKEATRGVPAAPKMESERVKEVDGIVAQINTAFSSNSDKSRNTIDQLIKRMATIDVPDTVRSQAMVRLPESIRIRIDTERKKKSKSKSNLAFQMQQQSMLTQIQLEFANIQRNRAELLKILDKPLYTQDELEKLAQNPEMYAIAKRNMELQELMRAMVNARTPEEYERRKREYENKKAEYEQRDREIIEGYNDRAKELELKKQNGTLTFEETQELERLNTFLAGYQRREANGQAVQFMTSGDIEYDAFQEIYSRSVGAKFDAGRDKLAADSYAQTSENTSEERGASGTLIAEEADGMRVNQVEVASENTEQNMAETSQMGDVIQSSMPQSVQYEYQYDETDASSRDVDMTGRNQTSTTFTAFQFAPSYGFTTSNDDENAFSNDFSDEELATVGAVRVNQEPAQSETVQQSERQHPAETNPLENDLAGIGENTSLRTPENSVANESDVADIEIDLDLDLGETATLLDDTMQSLAESAPAPAQSLRSTEVSAPITTTQQKRINPSETEENSSNIFHNSMQTLTLNSQLVDASDRDFTNTLNGNQR